MRITKKWLKDAKLRIRTRIDEVFKFGDLELKALVNSYMPACKMEGSRDKMLQQMMIWALEEGIPDSMTW